MSLCGIVFFYMAHGMESNSLTIIAWDNVSLCAWDSILKHRAQPVGLLLLCVVA